MKSLPLSPIAFLLLFVLISGKSLAQIAVNAPNTESILYLGIGENQPLIVGLGGSEGGNAWASNYWKTTRDQFLAKGYAFLAIGYFGAKGTPKILDKIAIEDMYNAIVKATENPKINKTKIAIIGGSRGADLALLLGSYYHQISCVVGIVPSHVAFPGHTDHFTTSCWTFDGKELPFIPVNEASVPFLIKGDLRGAFETMLTDKIAEEQAWIQVEKINGAIFLLSATEDEVCPSTPMSEKMMARLKSKNFRHPYEHQSIMGNHAAPLQHFDLVFNFLEKHFR